LERDWGEPGKSPGKRRQVDSGKEGLKKKRENLQKGLVRKSEQKGVSSNPKKVEHRSWDGGRSLERKLDGKRVVARGADDSKRRKGGARKKKRRFRPVGN